MSFAPLAASNRIDRGNIQSHSREAALASGDGVADSNIIFGEKINTENNYKRKYMS